MSVAAMSQRNLPSRATLLALITVASAGCADNVVASRGHAQRRPPMPAWEMAPLQRQLLTMPVSPEAAAGRPATRADLEEARGWFGPGEMEAVLAIVNRSARARGADTLPHCLPLCEPGDSGVEHGAR